MKNQKGTTLIEALVAIIAFVGLLSISPMLCHWEVNMWLHWAHKPETFGWLPAAVIGVLFGYITTPLAILTYIATFFIV